MGDVVIDQGRVFHPQPRALPVHGLEFRVGHFIELDQQLLEGKLIGLRRALQDLDAEQTLLAPIDLRIDASDVPVDMDDVVMLSATGGTTGMPKGVMNTHRSTQTFCAHFMIGCP